MHRERNTDVFESAIQASLSWIHEFGVALGQTHTASAYRCLRASLHAIRDRLPISDVVALGSQLPTLLRGAYFEGYRAARPSERARAGEPIDERLRCELAGVGASPEDVLCALLTLLGERVDASLVRRVREHLPEELRDLDRERPVATARAPRGVSLDEEGPLGREPRARRPLDEKRT